MLRTKNFVCDSLKSGKLAFPNCFSKLFLKNSSIKLHYLQKKQILLIESNLIISTCLKTSIKHSYILTENITNGQDIILKVLENV